jgi:hypothetical protein
MFSTVPTGISVRCVGTTVVLPYRVTYMWEPLPRERSNFAPLFFNRRWNSALFIGQEYT